MLYLKVAPGEQVLFVIVYNWSSTYLLKKQHKKASLVCATGIM